MELLHEIKLPFVTVLFYTWPDTTLPLDMLPDYKLTLHPVPKVAVITPFPDNEYHLALRFIDQNIPAYDRSSSPISERWADTTKLCDPNVQYAAKTLLIESIRYALSTRQLDAVLEHYSYVMTGVIDSEKVSDAVWRAAFPRIDTASSIVFGPKARLNKAAPDVVLDLGHGVVMRCHSDLMDDCPLADSVHGRVTMFGDLTYRFSILRGRARSPQRKFFADFIATDTLQDAFRAAVKAMGDTAAGDLIEADSPLVFEGDFAIDQPDQPKQ